MGEEMGEGGQERRKAVKGWTGVEVPEKDSPDSTDTEEDIAPLWLKNAVKSWMGKGGEEEKGRRRRKSATAVEEDVKVLELKEELNDRQAEVGALHESLSLMKVTLRRTCEELEAEKARAESNSRHAEDIKKAEVQVLCSENSRLSSSNERLSISIGTLQGKLASKEEQILLLEGQLAEKKSDTEGKGIVELQEKVAVLESDLASARREQSFLREQCSKFEREKSDLSKKIAETVDDSQELQATYAREVSEKIAICNEENGRQVARLKEEIAKLNAESTTLKEECRKAKSEAKEKELKLLSDAESERKALANDSQRKLDEQARDHKTELAQTIKAVEEKYTQKYKELNERIAEEVAVRKKLHNTIQDLKGAIRVFVRVRPMPLDTEGQPSVSCQEEGKLEFLSNESRAMVEKAQVFDFDAVFQQESTNNQVYEELEPLVQSVLDGFNVTVMAYGQTGTGKTYTMEGTESDPGVNIRAIESLFELSKEMAEKEQRVDVSVTYLEIYNESLRDLLSSTSEKKKLDIRAVEGKGTEVQGLNFRIVKSTTEVIDVLSDGRRSRATASTNMNIHSSRSHAVLSVYVTVTNLKKSTATLSKLHLIDLAGSERVSKSGVTNDETRLREAQMINKSLSAVSDVIGALQKRQQHIPFRNSKLTHFLADSLGGNSKTLFSIMLRPELENAGETLSSLGFGKRLKLVELGKVKKAKTESIK